VRHTSDLSFIGDLPVEWSYGCLGTDNNLEKACEQVDAICHCAALTRALNEDTFYRVNSQGTVALARAGMEANPDLKRFLYVSSYAAAGPSRGPDDVVDESTAPHPITWYGKSKWAAEQALLDMSDWLPLTIVRPAIVFGPRERDLFTYFDLVKWRLNLQLGRSDRWIGSIYIHDLVRLLILALESEAASGQTYLGCTQTHTYVQLSEAIVKALNKRTLHVTLPEAVLTPMAVWSRVQGRLTGRPALLNDQRILDMREQYWLCSGDKARRELGFEAEYDLETAVRETADWYLENGWL
jgi:nucleoside-diphosphate-sugar epimerase